MLGFKRVHVHGTTHRALQTSQKKTVAYQATQRLSHSHQWHKAAVNTTSECEVFTVRVKGQIVQSKQYFFPQEKKLLPSSGRCRKIQVISGWIPPVTSVTTFATALLAQTLKISSAVLIKLGWPHTRKQGGFFFSQILPLLSQVLGCMRPNMDTHPWGMNPVAYPFTWINKWPWGEERGITGGSPAAGYKDD